MLVVCDCDDGGQWREGVRFCLTRWTYCIQNVFLESMSSCDLRAESWILVFDSKSLATMAHRKQWIMFVYCLNHVPSKYCFYNRLWNHNLFVFCCNREVIKSFMHISFSELADWVKMLRRTVFEPGAVWRRFRLLGCFVMHIYVMTAERTLNRLESQLTFKLNADYKFCLITIAQSEGDVTWVYSTQVISWWNVNVQHNTHGCERRS